jgi:hypothetical protein
MYYSVFLHKLLSIRIFIDYLLYRFFPGYWSDWLYSHCDFLKVKDYIYINVFIYDGSEEYLYRRKSAYLLKHFFGKLWLSKYWVKSYLVDWNRKAQKLYLLLQVIGFTVDARPLEDLTLTLSKRNQKKIQRLKRIKGRRWKAREELYALKLLALFLQLKGYSKFVVKFLYKYYRRLLKKKLDNLVIIEAYKRAFLAIGFIDSVFRVHSFTYPGRNWMFSVLVRLLKVFNCYFIHKPIFYHVAKFIEWMLVYCGIKSYVKFFSIDNTCLTASFIAKYIASSIRKGYHYQHVYRPICKSLDKQLRIRFIGKLKKSNNSFVRFYSKIFSAKENSILYSFSKRTMIILLERINFFFNYNYLINSFRKRKKNKKIKYFFNKRMSNIVRIRDISLRWKSKLKRRRYINVRFKEVKVFIVKYKIKISGFFLFFKKFFFVNGLFFKEKLFFKKYRSNELNLYKIKKFPFIIEKLYRYTLKKKKALDFIARIKKHSIKFKNTILLLKKIFFLKVIVCFFWFARFFLIKKRFLFKERGVDFKFGVFKYMQIYFEKLNCVVNLLLLRFIANCNLYVINCFCNYIYIKNFSYRLLKTLNKSFISIVKMEDKKTNIKKKNSPLKSKNTSIEYLSKKTDILYGYKFHFVGRFTRKQRAANMWFVKGALFKSTRNINLDYGWQIVVLQFSVCAVKIWLSKSVKSPTYVMKLV